MKQNSSLGYVSASAFIHATLLVGLMLSPALRMLPESGGGSGATVEIIDEAGVGSEPVTPAAPVAPTAAAVEPQPAVVAPKAKAEVQKVVETELPAKKKSKKVVMIDAMESPAAEAPVIEKSAIDEAAETAAAEAIAQQDVEEELAAPATKPVVERLSQIEESQTEAPSTTSASEASGEGTGESANDVGGAAGPSTDELRSYLDLKQLNGNRAPQYPSIARRTGQQGQVVLKYFVTAQGSVQDVQVAQSSGYPMLDREASRAISQYKYVPGQEGWTQHPVVFSLKGQASPDASRLRTAGKSSNTGNESQE